MARFLDEEAHDVLAWPEVLPQVRHATDAGISGLVASSLPSLSSPLSPARAQVSSQAQPLAIVLPPPSSSAPERKTRGARVRLCPNCGERQCSGAQRGKAGQRGGHVACPTHDIMTCSHRDCVKAKKIQLTLAKARR